ncbi:SGNH/GDSL hydrolase family protein [Salipiger profundus]|uniref:Uncharacterized protein n=1 Tax=Salipiger profundus TaxID=1229727 RepID=A0A1U7DDW6_9RHOB|nr:SGNH/GDSL hydrolase family protein [Salipiger profundus]APX26351.1 hypothetical protein Ga0080559_TMP5251 [Salipiger profundus]GGA21869.1 hypothetical protein GCM10011326_38060 [Salipiger profundus]
MPLDVLVIGFSVTADPRTFVEMAQGRPGVAERYRLGRVAIGGITVHGLRFLLPGILQRHRPDLVVLEIGTTGFRTRPEPDAKYAHSVAQVMDLLQGQGQRTAVFDLPRKETPDPDWQAALHEAEARARGFAYRSWPLDEGLLRDYVHASPEGHEVYADRLLTLVDEAFAGPGPHPGGTGDFPLMSLPLADHAPADLARLSFRRTGFETEMVSLPEGRSLRVPLPPGMRLAGLTLLRGPSTGEVALRCGDADLRHMAYDQWSYYTRFAVWNIWPREGDHVEITQCPGVPEIDLLKGDKTTGPRVGQLGHLLLERSAAV